MFKRFKRKQKPRGLAPALAGRLIDSVDFCALDCEMTGLDPKRCQLISLGAVLIRNGRIELGQSFYRVIKPPRLKMSRQNALIHRLSHDQVTGGVDPLQAMADFDAFAGDAFPVGHFVTLDLAFLDSVREALGRPPMSRPAIDTRKLYEWKLAWGRPGRPRREPLQLNAVCRDLDTPQFSAHHAYFDALSTAHLFLKLTGYARQAGYYTLGELTRLGGV